MARVKKKMIKDTKHSFYLRSLYYNSCVIVAVIFLATWQLFLKKRSIIHQIRNVSLFVDETIDCVCCCC